MCYVKRNFLRVWLAACLLAAFSFAPNSLGMKKEEIVAKVESVQTDWMKHVNSYIGENKSGTLLRQGSVHPEFSRDEGHEFEAMDKQKKPVIFEWDKFLVKEEAFGKNMREIANIWATEFAEVDFRDMKQMSTEQLSMLLDGMAKQYGEEFQTFIELGAIKKDEKTGILEIIDWDIAKQIYTEASKLVISNVGETHCIESRKFDLDAIIVFVKVKDKETKELIGYALFSIGNESPERSVCLDNIAIEQKSQSRGLGKLLTSSIVKILPDIKQIFLGVLASNEKAVNAYKSWGFVVRPKSTEVEGENVRDFTMDYFVEKENKLQDAAKNLKLVK